MAVEPITARRYPDIPGRNLTGTGEERGAYVLFLLAAGAVQDRGAGALQATEIAPAATNSTISRKHQKWKPAPRKLKSNL
jgi:hypothetical protein